MTSTGIARNTSTTAPHSHRTGRTDDRRPTPSSRPITPAAAIEIAAARRVPRMPGRRYSDQTSVHRRGRHLAASSWPLAANCIRIQTPMPIATRSRTPATMRWLRRVRGPGASNRTDASELIA